MPASKGEGNRESIGDVNMAQSSTQPNASKLAIVIQQGKVLDFIDGVTQRNETPEEYVRQEIAKSLVREYRYEKTYIEVEFTIRVGSRKPRADLVIFPPATDHKQENALIIVECKSAKVKSEDKKDGVGQLQSYMAACQTSPMECGRTASSGFATDVSSKAARLSSRTYQTSRNLDRTRDAKIGPDSISSNRPLRMRCSLDSGAATTTLPEIRGYRSRRRSGNC